MPPDLATAGSGRDLIPGDPDEVEQLGSRLSVLGTGMSDAASRLTTLDAGDWQGQASDAFQRTLGEQPQKYAQAGEAFSSATGALRRYADVLRSAQADADRAIAEYQEAESRTASWRQAWDAHDAQVRRLEASSDPAVAGSAASLPRPSSTDPGEFGRGESRQLVANAQSSVEQEGQAAAAVLSQAAEGAPDEPGFWGSLWGGMGDFFGGLWENTLGGIIDTVGAFLDDPLGFLGDVWDNIYDHIAIWNWDTFWGTWWADIKDLIAWDDWAAGRPWRALGKIAGTLLLGLGAGKLVLRLLRRRGGRPGSGRRDTESPPASRGAPEVRTEVDRLPPGRSRGVRVVRSEAELNDLYNRLSDGGTPVTSGYPGELVRLPDGTTVGLRPSSRSGGATIDIKYPSGETAKVHIEP